MSADPAEVVTEADGKPEALLVDATAPVKADSAPAQTSTARRTLLAPVAVPVTVMATLPVGW